jgi:hypothetical protein
VLAVVRSTALEEVLVRLMRLARVLKMQAAAAPGLMVPRAHLREREQRLREQRSRRVQEPLKRARPLKAC